MSSMKIKDMMQTDPVLISPDTDFHSLFCRFSSIPGSLLIVVDDDKRLLGVVTSYDVLRRMVPHYMDSHLASTLTDDELLVKNAFTRSAGLTARDVMVTNVLYVAAGDPFMRAKAIINDRGINALPVVDAEGRVVGEVCRKDVLAYLSTHCLQCACELSRTPAKDRA